MNALDTIETLQRQASESLALGLMRMSVSDQATKDRLQSLLDATERHDAARRAAEAAGAKATAAKDAADERIAAAEKRAGEVDAFAETHRRNHAQKDADLRAGLADLAQQRQAIAAESLALDTKRQRHAHAIATLRNYLAGENHE